MDFNNLIYFGSIDDDRTPRKRDDVPDQYRQFLPENIVKDKTTYPYTYDPFIIYFNEKTDKEAITSLYTDRLLRWDYEKHDRLCRKHFGNERQSWDNRDHKKIEAFLSDWVEKKVTLIANIQYVNIGNGYPTWRLDYFYE
jgi:hypothetical protein